jgi:hypothetical protein
LFYEFRSKGISRPAEIGNQTPASCFLKIPSVLP